MPSSRLKNTVLLRKLAKDGIRAFYSGENVVEVLFLQRKGRVALQLLGDGVAVGEFCLGTN